MILLMSPKASINAICRECTARDIPVNKRMVAKVRNKMKRAVQQADREARNLTKMAADPYPRLKTEETPVQTQTAATVEIKATAPNPEARRRTTAGMMLRRQRLNELLDENPGADPAALMGRIREEFGVGLAWDYVYDTCRVAREMHGLPRIPEYGPHGVPRTVDGSPQPLPKFAAEEGEYAETPEEEFTWLARQANDIMRAHGLTELSLVVENGRAKWRYQVVKKAEGEIAL